VTLSMRCEVEQPRLRTLRDLRLPETDPPGQQAAAGAEDQAADDVVQPIGHEIVTHKVVRYPNSELEIARFLQQRAADEIGPVSVRRSIFRSSRYKK
jgi:hypothetical protein